MTLKELALALGALPYSRNSTISACDLGRSLDAQTGLRPLPHKLKLPREPAPISVQTYNNLFKQWVS